jgi:hypothetical protein
VGFIAQELDQVSCCFDADWLKLVKKDNPDRFEATPHNLFPVVIKAIQDLADDVDALRARVDALEALN